MKKFSMAGTLGDAFIVYCKLYDYWKRTGQNIGLYRYSAHVNFDKPISEFFNNIPFVEYLAPCIYNEYGGIRNIKNLKAPYIDTHWDGQTEPYPEVFIKSIKSGKNKFHIGIQYRCGRGGKGSNRRGISLKWIRDLRKILPSEFYSIFLFGTLVEDEDQEEIENFCQCNNIKSFVNKTDFSEWLARILGLDFFITFEGFSAYFSMSQKVPSLVFVIVPEVLNAIHPEWKKNNIIYQIKHPLRYRLLRKSPHYSPNTYPIDVNLAKKIIEKEYAKNNR